MKQLSNEESPYITAEELREMTATKEDLFERDRENVKQNLFESMVKVATQTGNKNYEASLNPNFDIGLLEVIKKDLEGFGYQVQSKTVEDERIGKFISLNISWGNTPQEVVQEAVSQETQQQQ